MTKIIEDANNSLDTMDFIAYGTSGDFLTKIPDNAKDLQPVPINTIRFQPWNALHILGIKNAHILQENTKNIDPFSGFQYFAIVPWILLAKDISQYPFISKLHHADFIKDADWHKKFTFNDFFMSENLPTAPNSIIRGMMGSGYTEHMLPDDGNPHLGLYALTLDNGDYVVCWAWEWVNK